MYCSDKGDEDEDAICDRKIEKTLAKIDVLEDLDEERTMEDVTIH